MFSFGNISVSDAEDTLRDLLSLQKALIDNVDVEARRINSGLHRSQKELASAVGSLVIVDDLKRYDLLTSVANEAGVDQDYSLTVKICEQEDRENRAERGSLEKEWGSRQIVAQKIMELKEELKLTQSANHEVGEEIKAWDVTTSAIEAHNKKYPGAQITEGNHDTYEKFRLGRWMNRYTLGLIFNRFAGPHEAYKIIAPYNESFGDYYEDRLSIYKLRETHANILAKQEQEQARYDELESIANRMDTLDRSYRGPERIADMIRDQVSEMVLRNEKYATELLDNFDNAEPAIAAINAAARINGYQRIEPQVARLMQEAEETYKQLKDPADVLERGAEIIPNHYISYDFSNVRYHFDAARQDFSTALDKLAQARGALDYLSANTVEIAKHRMTQITNFDASVPDRTFDLDSLEDEVREEIREEEERRAEAERLRREEERRAREAAEIRRAAEARRINDIMESSRRARNGGGGNVLKTGKDIQSPAPSNNDAVVATSIRRP